MKLVVLGALMLFPWLLSAEVVVEFKHGDWSVVGGDEDFSERVEREGICFRADAKLKLKKAAEILADIEGRVTYPIRFALAGQEGNGATLEPFLPDDASPSSLIVVTCAPEGVDVGCIEGTEPLDSELKETGRMGVDFEGLEKFLRVVDAGVQRAKLNNEKPMFLLNVRSASSWGQMVRVMQLVREGGCNSGIVRLDDEFPGLDFIVKMDSSVEPPIGKISNSESRERIVVNLSEVDGMSDAAGAQLADEKSLGAYIENERKRIELLGKEPVIFLRGSKQTIFARSRNVIRVASNAGVDKVVFGTYEIAKKSASTVEVEEKTPMTKSEDDANLTIPVEEEENESSRKVFVALDVDGGIRIDADRQPVDRDTNSRQLPELHARLQEIQKAAIAEGADINVVIWAAPKCEQQRVIDILSTLASLGISKVIFTDEKPNEKK